MNATVCGFCGHDFTGRYVMPSGVSSGPSFGWVRWLVIFMVLAITGGSVAIFLMVGNEVDNVLEDVPNFEDSFPDGGGLPGGPDSDNPLADRPGAYKTARELFKDMNANGLDCKNFSLITENQSLQAGSCTSEAVPLSIQVFYDELSYNSVVGNYRTNDAINVAFGSNWTVLAPTKKDARRVAQALDGKVG